MRNVIITEEQRKIIGSKKTGLTSGRKDKITGEREKIFFCSSLDFSIAFGQYVEKIFIEI